MDDTQKAIASGINPMLVKLYNMLPNFPQQGAPVDKVPGMVMNPGGQIAEAIMPILKSIMQGLEFQQPAMASGGLREEAQQIPGEGLTDPKTGVKIPTLQAIPAKVPTYQGGQMKLQPTTALPPMQSTGGSGMPAQMYGQLPPDVTPGDIKRWSDVLGGESAYAKNIPGAEDAPPAPTRKPKAPAKPKPKPKVAQTEELPWLVRGLGEQR